MARFAGGLVAFGLTILGSIIMVTPSALWVAWTEMLLLAVLAMGILAAVLYCVLVRFETPTKPAKSSVRSMRVERLPGKFIEDLQRLHPFIHHHQPSGSPRFRRAMHRLKKLLYPGAK